MTDWTWDADKIRENASNWSLEGDSRLLQYMQSIAKKLEERCKTTQSNINSMMIKIDESHINLSNTTNKLLALQNTQYVENRIQDDDETMPNEISKPTSNKNQEPPVSRMDAIKIAIDNGMSVMDKHFEKVTLDFADSDDDEEELETEKNIIFRPIDPFLSRPLPYLIGTKEWKDKWHIGLMESDDESDAEEPQKYSESSSDDLDFSSTQSLPSNPPTMSESDSSTWGHKSNQAQSSKIVSREPSEEDQPAIFQYQRISHMVKTPLPNNVTIQTEPENRQKMDNFMTEKTRGLFDDSDEENDDFIKSKSNKVISSSNNNNNNPSNVSAFFNGQTLDRKPLNLFNEVPPSLDIPDNIIKKPVNIFTDSDEENSNFIPTTPPVAKTNNRSNSFYNDKPPEDMVSSTKSVDVEDDDFDSFINKLEKPQNQSKSKTKISNLFDDDDSNEYDNFFNTIKKNSSVKSSANKNITKLFDDDDDRDFIIEGKKEKVQPRITQPVDNKKEINVSKPSPDKIIQNQVSSTKSAPSAINSNIVVENKVKQPLKKTSLFSDDEDDDIFSSRKKIDHQLIDKNVIQSNIEIVSPPLPVPNSEEYIKPKIQNLSDEISKPKSALPSNIFDDLPPDDDNNSSEYLSATSNLCDNLEAEPNIGPIDKNKLIVDEEKVENEVNKKDHFKDKFKLFENSENEPAKPSENVRRSPVKISNNFSKLFDTQKSIADEAPPKEDSKPLPKRLSHNININVSALLPGAKRPQSIYVNKSTDDEQSHGLPDSPEPINTTPKFISSTPNEANPNILTSLNKTRPKIQSQRRPSTRKGRQTSYQKSLHEQNQPESVDTQHVDKGLTDIPPKFESIHDQLSNAFKDSATKPVEEISSTSNRDAQMIENDYEYTKVTLPASAKVLPEIKTEPIFEKMKKPVAVQEPIQKEFVEQNVAKKPALPDLTNLFDDEPPEDIFDVKPSITEVKTSEPLRKTVLPSLSKIFNDEPPDMDFGDEQPIIKNSAPANKPTLKQVKDLPKLSNIFDDEPPEDDFEDIFVKKSNPKQMPIKTNIDADEEFLGSSSSKTTKISNVNTESFGRISNVFLDEPPPLDDSPPSSNTKSTKLSFNMFDDNDDPDLDDEDLFVPKMKPGSESKKIMENQTAANNSLFTPKTTSADITVNSTTPAIIPPAPQTSTSSSLKFNMCGDDDDIDIFAPPLESIRKVNLNVPPEIVSEVSTKDKEPPVMIRQISEEIKATPSPMIPDATSADPLKPSGLKFDMFDDMDNNNSDLDDIFVPKSKTSASNVNKVEPIAIAPKVEAPPVSKPLPTITKSVKSSKKSLFSDDEDDDDLFGAAAKLAKKAIKKPVLEKKTNLFGSDDDDDDDDIFGGNTGSKNQIISKKTHRPFNLNTEDDDDDDDLFNSKSKEVSQKRTTITTKTEKKSATKSIPLKDPLADLF